MIRQLARPLLLASLAVGASGCTSDFPIDCAEGTHYRKAKVLGRKSDVCINSDQKLHGALVTWHDNGKKQSAGSYQDGLAHGEFKQWSEDARLLGTYTMTEGTGSYIWWHEADKKSEETAYEKGKQQGQSTSWHKNGERAAQGDYEKGKKQGEWSHWGEDGKLQKVEVYAAGKLKATRKEKTPTAE